MKKKIGTSKSMKKYKPGGNVAPGTEDPKKKSKTYSSDSLSIARNERIINSNKTSPSQKNRAEDNMRSVADKYKDMKQIRSMGPAGKNLYDAMTGPDYISGNKKNGGSVGKSKMKMGGSCGTPKTLKKKK
jgi:Zn-dependent metalloprotease